MATSSKAAKAAESEAPESAPLPGADLGAVAYGAYSASVGGKSVSGQKLPSWEDQKEEIRAAWAAGALAVLAALYGEKG